MTFREIDDRAFLLRFAQWLEATHQVSISREIVEQFIETTPLDQRRTIARSVR
jgi:hypothetical protein